MKRKYLIFMTAIVGVGAILLAVSSEWNVASKKAPSAKNAIGPLPSPASFGGIKHRSQQSRIKNRVSLDRIAGASFQQVYTLLSDLSSREITDLARELAELPVGGISNAKIALFFKAWSQLDPQAAFSATFLFEQAWAKQAAMQSIVDGMSPAAAPDIVSLLNNLPRGIISDSLKTMLLSKGIIKWSQASPSAAAEYLSSAEGRVFPSQTWQKVAENWAGSDPEAALDWVQKQSDDKNLRSAFQGLMGGWWQRDPVAAQDYSAAHVNTLNGQQAATVIANKMAFEDPKTAARWASELTNRNARQMSQLSIGAAWAHQDPEAASKWVASLPAEDKKAVISSVASSWAYDDPQAAGKWLATLSGTGRDEAITAFSATAANIDPGTALSWALSVSDPEQRRSNAQRIAVNWMMRQPAQAKNWIEQSALTNEDKNQLLNLAPAPAPTP